MTKMNPVVHFELPVKDKERSQKFYSSVFGWKMEQMPSDMGDYVVATTTEIDEKTHFPKEPGRINGGMYKRDPNNPEEAPSCVIAVDDIKEHIEKIKAAGGEILNGPHEIPGIGTYASFKDTEGNRMSILQPSPMM